jgi:hypothetical protein
MEMKWVINNCDCCGKKKMIKNICMDCGNEICDNCYNENVDCCINCADEEIERQQGS